MIINAEKAILGRVATAAAKAALKGEEVIIVNCEKAVITGNRKQILENYAKKFDVGQVNQGPYFPRRPDMLVRRTVRGMLPRKKPRGKAALGRVKCYIGIPPQVKAEDAKPVPEAGLEKIMNAAHMTVLELCKHIGYKQA